MDRPAPPVTNPIALVMGGLIAMAAALGVGRFVYTPILPFMVSELGLSTSAAGLIASANFAGYLAGALVAATPFIKGSRRAWLLGSLIASALTTGSMGIVSTVPQMMALRFVGGFASAFVLIFVSSLVLDRLRSSGRPGLMTMHFAGVGIGIALSSVIVTGLDHFGSDWRALWLASGAISLAATIAVLFLVPGGGDPPAVIATTGKGDAAGFRALTLSYGLFGFGYVITATFIVVITRGSPAIRPLEPAIWLIVGLAGAPSVWIWGLIGNRIGSTLAYAIACLIEAVGVVASVLWVSAPGIILASFLLGGTIMGITALGIACGRNLAPENPRRAVAVMTAAFGLGQIIGPIVAGWMVDLTGSFIAPSLMAAATLVVSALLALWVRSRRLA